MNDGAMFSRRLAKIKVSGSMEGHSEPDGKKGGKANRRQPLRRRKGLLLMKAYDYMAPFSGVHDPNSVHTRIHLNISTQRAPSS